ncbi:MAG: hypothetical protein ACD_46C00084G0002 [uncultured bacterium]|nr:MAG: hypothetical protein ACD_46C00084G0002 [uncultured bacterium]
MSETQTVKARQSVAIDVAKNLSVTTNTSPQMPSKTPRWLLRLLPIVNVESGIYRVNRVGMLSDLEIILSEQDNQKITPDVLHAIPVFSGVSHEFLEKMIGKMIRKKVKAGDLITKQGSADCRFYIVLNGRFDVSIVNNQGRSVVIRTITSGDHFGSLSLIEGTPRQSTVYAAQDGELIELDKKTFDEIFKDPHIREQLQKNAQTVRDAYANAKQRDESQAPLLAGYVGEQIIPSGYVNYEKNPKEIHLSVIQTTIGVHTRITDIYNVPYDQLEQQLHVTLENIHECEEFEIINNPSFGLLSNISSQMKISTRQGPPTPDDFDELISLVWKEPSFFLAHPKAIAAFGRECTSRGVPPPTVEMMGSRFITWRGVPLIPSDKLQVRYVDGQPTTDILLMRTGEAVQGVVSLSKKEMRHEGIRGISVKFMGVNEYSIANYMLTKYFSVAILVPDAVGLLTNVKLSHYEN